MMRKRQEPELIRRYLLGDLDEGQRERLEEQLLMDEELQADLSNAEDALIDDYVSGALTERERDLFKTNLLLTPDRLHKLRLSQALMKYAEENASDFAEAGPGATVMVWQRAWQFIQRRRLAVAVAGVILLFIIGYGGWNLYQHRQLENRRSRLRSQRIAGEQELARLNANQVTERQATIIPLMLRHLLMRTVGETRRATITEEIEILQLRLELEEDKYPFYRAVIESDDGVEMYAVDNLKARATDGGVMVILNLPGRLLPTGNYQVHLSAKITSDQSVDIGRYPFEVVLK